MRTWYTSEEQYWHEKSVQAGFSPVDRARRMRCWHCGRLHVRYSPAAGWRVIGKCADSRKPNRNDTDGKE